MHSQGSPPRRAAVSMRSRRRVRRWLGRNWARLSYARRIEPTWLELTRLTVPIVGLPEEFHNYRIVQLSDLHAGRHARLPYLLEAVELANAQQPDVVALTGDFIHKGFRHIHEAAEAMGRLQARSGVFAVLGNHDFSVRNALGIRRHRHLHLAVAEALTDRGIKLLRNDSFTLRESDAELHLVGVDDLWSRHCDPSTAFRDVPPEAPRVVLAHNPRTIERLGTERCDLMLSGHTHGGQVNWPGRGRIFLTRKSRRFAAGLYRHQDAYLYVHRGVGCGWRFRFGVRPEVAVIDLRVA